MEISCNPVCVGWVYLEILDSGRDTVYVFVVFKLSAY